MSYPPPTDEFIQQTQKVIKELYDAGLTLEARQMEANLNNYIAELDRQEDTIIEKLIQERAARKG